MRKCHIQNEVKHPNWFFTESEHQNITKTLGSVWLQISYMRLWLVMKHGISKEMCGFRPESLRVRADTCMIWIFETHMWLFGKSSTSTLRNESHQRQPGWRLTAGFHEQISGPLRISLQPKVNEPYVHGDLVFCLVVDGLRRFCGLKDAPDYFTDSYGHILHQIDFTRHEQTIDSFEFLETRRQFEKTNPNAPFWRLGFS